MTGMEGHGSLRGEVGWDVAGISALRFLGVDYKDQENRGEFCLYYKAHII